MCRLPSNDRRYKRVTTLVACEGWRDDSDSWLDFALNTHLYAGVFYRAAFDFKPSSFQNSKARRQTSLARATCRSRISRMLTRFEKRLLLRQPSFATGLLTFHEEAPRRNEEGK